MIDPKILADQLSLSQPRGQIITTRLPGFSDFLEKCMPTIIRMPTFIRNTALGTNDLK